MSNPPTTHVPHAADAFEILLAHNRWGNVQVLEACRGLTHEQFHRTFPIGVGERGGLHLTMTHVVSAMGRWADRIRQIAPGRAALEPMPFVVPGLPPADPRDRSVDELLAINDQNSADLADGLAKARTIGLGKSFEVPFPSPQGLKTASLTRAAAITHVLTHGYYHRAQALNMLRHLGIAGVSDKLPKTSVTEWQVEGEMYL
jgi:uncharacterized damage-inducible protein DinB